MAVEITTGDYVSLVATLKKDNATFDMSSATVKGALRSDDALITSEVTANSGTAGADWATSKVVIVFDETETAKLTHGTKVTLEIQVTEGGGPLTWHIGGITVKRGFIT
jgi:hypothetical protein